MFSATLSLRRITLLAFTALMSAAMGLAGTESADARRSSPPAAARHGFPTATSPVNPPGIAYTAETASAGMQLFMSNLTGTRRRQLTFGPSQAQQPRWGPFGGKILYLRKGPDDNGSPHEVPG